MVTSNPHIRTNIKPVTTAQSMGLIQPLRGYARPRWVKTNEVWLLPIKRYQPNNNAKPSKRPDFSKTADSGRSRFVINRDEVSTAHPTAHHIECFARSRCPRASQFFMWRMAPKIGVNNTLQMAAAVGFQSAGAAVLIELPVRLGSF